MNNDLRVVIARRTYFGLDGTPAVEVEIGAPAKSSQAEGEYICSFRLRQPGSEVVQTVYGIDELQALQLALGYVEAKLRALSSTGLPLRWLGDETGDLGIRIPTFS